MNINRYNYEEFFLLYVDNELTQAEHEEVDAFVHDNPDLEEELVMLKQSRLRPDISIQFPGKASLLKPEASGSFISEANYEEFFLLYADEELDTVARREVEEFAAGNPALQQELNLLLQAKAIPDHAIAFPDKSLLYKQPETGRKPVVIAWWRIAAVAAMVLLALGIFWISNTGTTGTDNPDVVAKNKKPQTTVTEQDKPVPTQNAQQEKDQPADVQEQPNQQLAVDAVDKKADRPGKKITPRYNEPAPQEKQLAYNEPVKDPGGETAKDPAIVSISGIESNTANKNISTGIETASLTSAFKAVGEPIVHTVANVGNAVQAEEQYDEAFGPIAVKKNKLRGLFRKVTRVFDKTTNIPGVGEKGILIGGFEIALK